MAVLVDSELGADLFIQLDHGAGESMDTRLVVPDGMARQLLPKHWHQIRAVDYLQLIMRRIAVTVLHRASETSLSSSLTQAVDGHSGLVSTTKVNLHQD